MSQGNAPDPDPSDLAAEIALGWPSEASKQLFPRLLPVIDEVARMVQATLPPRNPPVRAEAPSIAWETIRSDQRGRGSYRVWFYWILNNRIIDQHRRVQFPRLIIGSGSADGADPIASQEDPTAARGDRASSAAAQLQERLQRLRQRLDQLAQLPQDRSTTDRFAVLLLYLRAAMVKRLCRREGMSPWPRHELASLVCSLLLWRPAEEHRRILDCLPSLGEVWRKLAADLGEPPFRISPSASARCSASRTADRL